MAPSECGFAKSHTLRGEIGLQVVAGTKGMMEREKEANRMLGEERNNAGGGGRCAAAGRRKTKKKKRAVSVKYAFLRATVTSRKKRAKKIRKEKEKDRNRKRNRKR